MNVSWENSKDSPSPHDVPLEKSACSRIMIILKSFCFCFYLFVKYSFKAFYRYIYHVCEACICGLSVHFCEVLLFKIKAQRFVDIVSAHK